jgi:uncharacterized cupredoxin-like copper-binding protein
MRRFAPIATLFAVALLAGCGSSSSSSSSSGSGSASSAAPAAASSSALSLSESEFKITPPSAAVSATGKITITVKNTGAIMHALAVQTPSGIVQTSDISPGSSTTLTVDATKAGRYTFYCPIDSHRQMGMEGVLVVGGGSGSGAAAGGTTSSSASSSSPSRGSY